MKKIVLGMALVLSGAVSSIAQTKNITVTGTVIEADTKEPAIRATVQLLALPDSAYVAGIATTDKGRFTLPKVTAGRYVLQITSIGFRRKQIPIQLTSSNLNRNMGAIALESDAILLQEAVITAEAPEVTVVEDTLVYNASAYRTPQGAMLEELVKKLPGAEVSENGTITVNGKEIKKIMVGGKEFFTNDPSVAMKNIPVDMVDRVKAYDRQSDLARITGISDGEEETVLDLTVKKGMNQGWFGNLDTGYGNHDRYLGKAMLNRFADGDQYIGILNFNNINDRGFGGGNFRGGMRGNNGMVEKKNGGFNFATERKKIELGGSFSYDDSERNTGTKSWSERFLQEGSSFTKSNNTNLNRERRFNSDFRMEWKPDSMTNIIFQPSFSYTRTNSLSNSESWNSNADDFDEWSDNSQWNPFPESWGAEKTDPTTAAVNYNRSYSSSNGNSLSFSSNLQLNRKLNSKGRNITLRLQYGFGDSDSESFSNQSGIYFQRDSVGRREQRIANDGNNYSYRLQATYSEPIFTNRFLQFSYSYNHRYQETNRQTYDIDGDGSPTLNDSQSRAVENEYDNHEIETTLRTIREKYQYSIGVSLQPQHNSVKGDKLGQKVDTARSVVNFTPTFDFRYRFNKQTQLRIEYRGRTGQPSIDDLLPIRDESNPMSIREGNPGLKPSFSNNFRLSYNSFLPEKMMSVMTFINFSNTINSVSRKVTYDPESGVETTRPENINGNWNINGMFGFNTPLKNKKFTIGSYSNAGYSNSVGFASQKGYQDEKSATRSLNLRQGVRSSFRNDLLEVGLNANISYNRSRNSLQSNNNRETFDFGMGPTLNVTLPWDMSFSTDLGLTRKKGYSAELDRSETLWNVQLAKSFLKKKEATISLQVFDLLRQQTNLNRSITASMRQDSQYDMVNSYFMVHFIYRLNTFGANAPNRRGFGSGDGGPRGPGRPDGPGRRF